MKSEIILDKGNEKRRPIVIKTEAVERPAYLHQSRMSVATWNKPQTFTVTMPRVDALKKDPNECR